MRCQQFLFVLPIIFVGLAMSGCSTLNKSECLAVDWTTIGYEDGVAGHSGERISQHRKACAKHGVSPDLAAYQAGREQGLREFCQPANGFRLGAHGYSYAGVCSGELESAFLGSYDSGRELYVLQSRVSGATNQIEYRRQEIHRLENAIVKASALIVSGESTAEERAQAVVDTKHMAEKAGELKTEIRQLEQDRVHHERDLEEYRATLPLGS